MLHIYDISLNNVSLSHKSGPERGLQKYFDHESYKKFYKNFYLLASLRETLEINVRFLAQPSNTIRFLTEEG